MPEAPAPPAHPTDPPSADPSRRRRNWTRNWTLTVACLGVLLVIASMVALNTALPDIAMETSASQTQLTWIVDAYTLALACLLLPAGAIGDRYGRRGALVFGLVVFAAASAIPLVWTDPVIVVLTRAGAGVGAAFIMPATLSLLTSAYPKEQRAKPVGSAPRRGQQGRIPDRNAELGARDRHRGRRRRGADQSVGARAGRAAAGGCAPRVAGGSGPRRRNGRVPGARTLISPCGRSPRRGAPAPPWWRAVRGLGSTA